ncbi:C40 family peptidase [uncultured Tenacibaculum sp.]|uniref:C40 family peptidase n=1 Tax=uncultured Tenacibaculum sp. TaxID=174713 RepID=UPI00261AA2DE|nr:C40 family peptidase [uncultured Tenacibaculum sp.]
MIKKLLLLFLGALLMISCGSSKKIASSQSPKGKNITNKEVTVADKIVWTAVSYKGVPYKFGGMSKRGMDCSGLIHTSFKQRNVDLPRTSREMYTKGYDIPLKKVKRGDLLFFKTARKRGKVNHVGLVTSVKNGDIHFIHSTSSRGVIVTSLWQKYWRKAFIKAKRIL